MFVCDKYIDKNINMSSTLEQIPKDVSSVYLDNTTIQVNFTIPTDIINPYYYYRVVAYDDSGNIYDTSGTTSPIFLYNLTESTNYSYYIETVLFASSEIFSFRTQFPEIYTFYVSDISYNAAKLYWSGTDFSYIHLTRSNPNINNTITDISYIYDNTITSYYDNGNITSDISGNTLYYYYITPYLNINNIITTGITSSAQITTIVAPITDLSTTIVDSSSITLSFTAAKNSYNYSSIYTAKYTYTGINTEITDVSNSETTLILSDLSGNTTYNIYVIVKLDNSDNLIAKSSSIIAKTPVRPVYNVLLSFYDSSSIIVSYSIPPNTYTSSSIYTIYSIDGSGVQYTKTGTNSQLQIIDLSANSDFIIYVKTTLDGSSNLTANSNTIIGKTTSYPINNVIYFSDITYNNITINWAGIDISYVTVYRNNTNIGIDYITPYTDIDISGNTDYSYYVVPYLIEDEMTINGTPSATITTITPVSPATDLSMIFYDNSAITVSFIAGRNSYNNSIYYLATATTTINNIMTIIDISSSSVIPIQFTELSGNTYYDIYITTIIDNSLNATSLSSVSITTPIQSLNNPSIYYYDSSAIEISLGVLPHNSYNNNLYYIATATDNSGVTISSTITDINMTEPIITITGLSGNNLYYITGAVVVDGISSSIINIGTVTTEINLPYDISVTENGIKDINKISVLDVSFITPTQNNSVSYTYYIAKATDNNGYIIDASSNSSPILLYGLSGNTHYNITITMIIDGITIVSPSTTSITTAIQTPVDVEILFLEDASFTIGFTPLRNTTVSIPTYYILRATDVSSGDFVDVSSSDGVLSIYSLPNINTEYYIDILTAVDTSFVSYGGVFSIKN